MQKDIDGNVMQVPAQTMKQENDKDNGNDGKDPIFQDDTSKGSI